MTSILLTLPDDIIYDLLMWLQIRDIIRLCRTSASLNQLICSNQDLWRGLYRRDISTIREFPELRSAEHSHNSEDYHRAYVEAMQGVHVIESQFQFLCHCGERHHSAECFRFLIVENYDRLLERLMPQNWFFQSRLTEFLEEAVARSSFKIVKFLVDIGANLENVIRFVIMHSRSDVLELIVSSGFPLHSYISLLMQRINERDDLNLLEQALKLKIVDASRALVNLSYVGNLYLVKILLDRGINDFSAETLHQSLYNAYSQKHFDVAKLLVGAGAKWFSDDAIQIERNSN